MNVNSKEFKSLISSIEGTLLDVRTKEEVNEGHIKDATNIDFYASDFMEKISLIRKDIPIYVYCRSGGRSYSTAKKMEALGFENIYNLEGGIGDWNSNNYELEISILNESNKEEEIMIKDFINTISNHEKVLIDFNTNWCVPCRKMKPIVEEIDREDPDLKVIFIDADINKDIINHYKINGVPVFVLFQEGKEIWRHSGMITKEELTRQIK